MTNGPPGAVNPGRKDGTMKKHKHPRGYYRKAHEDAREAKAWLASKLAHIRPKAFRKKNYDRARNANEIATLKWVLVK